MICGLIWLSLFLITGIILLFKGYLKFREWKALAVTPTSLVVDIEPGKVEVKGKIESVLGGPLYSPITQRPCIQSEINVQEHQYDKYGKPAHWVTISTTRLGGPFLVADGSGKAVVDPKGVKMEMLNPVVVAAGPSNEMTLRAQEHIKRAKIRGGGPLGLWKLDMRVVESIVPPGENILVLGDAVDDPFYKRWQNDPDISPFAIKKKNMMMLSFKSEDALSFNKKTAPVLLFVFGALSILVGLAGLVFVLG